MKIAVTGASGFLGGHVLRELAGMPDVAVVATSRTRPAELPAGFAFVRSTLAEPEGLHEQLGRPDAVIHLAWSGLPNYLSLHHFESELPAQFRFLRTLVADGLPHLVVAGTCYEYGMKDGLLAEDEATEPTNPYGFAKDSLRRQLQFLSAVTPSRLTWGRLFYMYGTGQSPKSIFPLLKAAVQRGDSVFPMSRGDQLRDYLPVEEVARLLAALALRPAGSQDAEVVNICSGEPVSIRTLVESWIEANDWPIALALGKFPYPTYEPLAFWGARQRLDTLLGEQARIPHRRGGRSACVGSFHPLIS